MILDEEQIANGVDAISLVNDPAIESDFIALAMERVEFATVDKEKRIVMGPVLIPEKHILRKDENGDPFNIYFTADTIRQTSELFLKRGYQNSATLEHNVKLQGVTVVESWIVENPEMDKSKHYKLNVPQGTWMASMKIDNDEIWSGYVKTGKVKGFSIEGWFRHEEVKAAKVQKLTAKILMKL